MEAQTVVTGDETYWVSPTTGRMVPVEPQWSKDGVECCWGHSEHGKPFWHRATGRRIEGGVYCDECYEAEDRLQKIYTGHSMNDVPKWWQVWRY